MAAVDAPDAAVRPRPFTVDEYYAMAEAGLFGPKDRVELIRGQIMLLSPIGSRHAAVVARLTMLLASKLSGRAVVNVQSPVRLDRYSEPEPDLAVVRPEPDYMRRHPGPEDVLLLIEVADTTLRYDRSTKLPLYAQAGIAEVWIANIQDRCIEVYREPAGTGYATHKHVMEETIAPNAFPDVEVDAAALFR